MITDPGDLDLSIVVIDPYNLTIRTLRPVSRRALYSYCNEQWRIAHDLIGYAPFPFAIDLGGGSIRGDFAMLECLPRSTGPLPLFGGWRLYEAPE